MTVVTMAIAGVYGLWLFCAHDPYCQLIGVVSALDVNTPWGYWSSMQQAAKTSCIQRLSRIEGQVRGLSRMVGEDRYCIDIVTQIAAVRAALRRVEQQVRRDHVGHCVKHAMQSDDGADQARKIEELMDVLARSNG
jgi:CsoR family transcriptional regulator, copper-sensing transcriptional repressor